LNNTEPERADVSSGQVASTTSETLPATPRANEATAELLALCHTATEDGKLLGQDVLALQDWLEHYRDTDFPDAELVRDTIRRILTVEAISDAARHELYRTLERALPRDVTTLLRSRRRSAGHTRHAGAEPIKAHDVVVARTLYEDRAMSIARFAFEGDEVLLVRDPDYPHSKNAIMVRLLSGFDIGYIPEFAARSLAPHLDQDRRYTAHIRKIVNRDGVPVAIVAVDVFDDEPALEGLRRPSDQKVAALSLATPATPVRGIPRQDSPRRSGLLLFALVATLLALIISRL
jgi:HIRAN domain-containing protein